MEKFDGLPNMVGIPWYDTLDYGRVQTIMRDGHLLPPSHAAWLKQAERTEQEVRATGRVVVRAVIHPDEFIGWCRTHGLDVNAHARTHYASFVAAQQQHP